MTPYIIRALSSRREFLKTSAALLSVGTLGRIATAVESAEPKLPSPLTAPVAPVFPARIFDIRKFGAVCGGERLNTKPIAAAIAACARAGGGRVLVPSGVWLTGPVHLRSKVELHVTEDAELRFSRKHSDYLPVVYTQRGGIRCFNYSPLIYARDCVEIAVTGLGTLNGQGDAWWEWKKKQAGMQRLFEMGVKGVPVEQRVFGTEADGVRPMFVQFVDCRNVMVEGVTLKNSPSWTVHPLYCENVVVRGVTIANPATSPNTDGINPDSCRNVLIADCVAGCGDNCITLKSGLNEDGWAVGKPLENVTVVGCRILHGGGIAIGSEMSGGVRNVCVSRCQFTGSNLGIRLKTQRGRGGVVENVCFDDITMKGVRTAIAIDMFYYDKGGETKAEPVSRKTPIFRNIHISNVTAEELRSVGHVRGLTEMPLQGVSLTKARMSGKSGLAISNAAGVRFREVEINAATGPALVLNDVSQAILDRVEVGRMQTGTPAVRFVNVRGATLDRCRCTAGTDLFLQLEGESTAGIVLNECDLIGAQTSVVPTTGVKPGAYQER